MTRFFRMLRRVAVVVVLLLFLFLAMQLGDPFLRGLFLRNSILTAIASAKTIIVTEHSSPYDDMSAPKDQYREEILKKLDLSKEQIADLRRAFLISPDYSGTTGRACIFEDHHRIEIIQNDGDILTIDICFHCSELRINGKEKRIMPTSWPGSLSAFFGTLGMRPDGPFQK